MEIHGPGGVQGPDPIRPDRLASSRLQPPRTGAVADRAEISEIAKLKSLLKQVPDIRADRVERLRAEIAAGTYETDEKIQTVIDRLLEEL